MRMLWSNVNLRGLMRWRRRSADDFSDEIRAHIAHETDRRGDIDGDHAFFDRLERDLLRHDLNGPSR